MSYRDGQAPSQAMQSKRVASRNVDELIGICKGVLADGAVTQGEAEFLLSWLDTNRGVANEWPANVLYPRLQSMLEDGRLDDEEERELLELLMNMGARPSEPGSPGAACHLPIDDPAPRIAFHGSVFVVTGQFLSYPRRDVKQLIEQRGGTVGGSITKKTNYLVIGEIASPDWITSTYGRKIEAAVKLRDEGGPVVIVSEQHWLNYL